METFTIILAIIALAFGVLQIILFFKLWGMTNDVKELRGMTNDVKKLVARFAPPEKDRDVYRMIIKGDPQVGDVLYNNLFNELYDTYAEGDGIKLRGVIERYKKLYKRAHLDFPKEFENIKGFRDFVYLLDGNRSL